MDGYSKLAVPLTHLLKKEAAWTGREALPEDARIAFEAIKAALIKDCLLRYILPHTDFLLDVDASQTAIGACLQQYQAGELVMLAYCSKTLSTSRQNYCMTKWEMYACIYAMRYFQGFIKGQNTMIRTDHAALVWLLGFKGSDSMYHRWIAEMSSYEPYNIISRSGEQHKNADGMSRARKHCKFEQCESCAYHHKRNDWIRDSESIDSLDEDIDKNGRKKNEDQRDLAREAPDCNDYPTWDLELIWRKAHDDEW